MKTMKLVLLIVVPTMVFLILHQFWMPFLDFNHLLITVGSANNNERNKDKYMDGLLPTGFDQKTCLSRYQMNVYKKASPYTPSFPLLSKLRHYEALHRRCGPNSPSFHRALIDLTSVSHTNSSVDHCKYIVILTRDGLGNRILAVLSAFFYALISNRVILIEHHNPLTDLLCQPFLGSSWLLPSNFPLRHKFSSFRQSFPRSFGNLLRKGFFEESSPPPTYLFLYLSHDADDYDKLFYCDRQQNNLLNKVPWLIIETNVYFVPGIFLLSSFREELNKLFPAKDTVFHHLGRYLFHPMNDVWEMILRSYKPYVSRANEILGIQIRVFGSESGSIEDQMNQILACTQKNKLLPEIELSSLEKTTNDSSSQKVKVVLVTSLNSQYSETLKKMYWENPTIDGEVVAVYQPSHEGTQSFDNRMHNRKALMEMYLLSFSDVLVTSDWSTFGYVAHGLAGVKPWMLYKGDKSFEVIQPWLEYGTKNKTSDDWPCRQAVSMEPCFHTPPMCDCDEMKRLDAGNVLPYVTHCEDISWGLKLG